MSVKILCDSAADFTAKEIEEMGLLYVPIPVLFGDDSYAVGVNITHDEFYDKLAASPVFPTTSQPAPADFIDHFARAKDDGDEIVAILIPAGLSGTYQNANLAKNIVGYDGIHIIDGQNIVAALRIVIEKACKMRDDGASALEIVNTVSELKSRTHVYAALDTLENLYRGGRLTKAAAGIGELANIKPVVTLNEDGHVAIVQKALGKCKACGSLVKLLASQNLDSDYPVYYIYSKDTQNVDLLKTKMNNAGINTDGCGTFNLGPTIGTHIGPGAFGICFVAK